MYLCCDLSLPPISTHPSYRRYFSLHRDYRYVIFEVCIRVRLACQYFKLVIEIDGTNILCRGSPTNKSSDVLTINVGWYERVIPCEVFQDSVLEAGFKK